MKHNILAALCVALGASCGGAPFSLDPLDSQGALGALDRAPPSSDGGPGEDAAPPAEGGSADEVTPETGALATPDANEAGEPEEPDPKKQEEGGAPEAQAPEAQAPEAQAPEAGASPWTSCYLPALGGADTCANLIPEPSWTLTWPGGSCAEAAREAGAPCARGATCVLNVSGATYQGSCQ